MGQHTVHEWLSQARWDWAKVGLPACGPLQLLFSKFQLKLDQSFVSAVYILKEHRFGLFCLSAEWITIVYLTWCHWAILFCLKLQNNTQAHLRALWMSFASGTDSSAQESGNPPNTIFVRVALFQTFTVYYILLPSRFVQRWGFGYNLKISVKSTFMFLITLNHFKGYRKCF